MIVLQQYSCGVIKCYDICINICRWFTLTNRVNGEADIREGKLLLNLMYEPAAKSVSKGVASASINTSATRAKSVSEAVVDDADLSTESLSEKEKKKQVQVSPAEHKLSFPGSLPGSPEQLRATPTSSSNSSSGTSNISPAVAELPPVDGSPSAVRSRRNSSSRHSSRRPSGSSAEAAERICDAGASSAIKMQAAAIAVALGAAAAPHCEPPSTNTSAAAVPPSPTDFYQSIAEFTERTTNTIGNFFYEIEALHLSASTKDAIDGDWHDTTGSSSAPFSGGGGASSSRKCKAEIASGKLVTTVDNAPALGVGYMHIHVVSAFKSKVRDVSDGDHYVLACVEDTKREFKSKCVFGSATPIFNVRWTIKMEHYRAAVILYLMDAHTHRRIASCRFSCFSLMQRNADSHARHWKDTPIEKIPLRNISDGEEMGFLNAQVAFQEDLQGLFLGDDLHDAPPSPPELLSVQRLGTHIARFTAIIELFNQWYAEYLHIMEWKDPMSTLVMFLVFLYFTLKVQAEYALSGVMFVVVVLMTRTYLRRRNGQYIKHYVELGVKAAPKFDYKPIGRLRVTVLGFRQAESSENIKGMQTNFARPTMKLSYQPMPEIDASTKSPGEASESFTIGYFGNSLSGVGFSIPEPSQGVSQLMSNMVGAEVVAKDSIIHSVYDPWPAESTTTTVQSAADTGPYVKSETPDLSLVYPVLQPLTAKVVVSGGGVVTDSKSTAADGGQGAGAGRDRSGSSPTLLEGNNPPSSSSRSSSSCSSSSSAASTSNFLPWELNESSVKVSFIDDQHSSFGGPNEEYVSLPLKDIVASSKGVRTGDTITYEMKKWYGVKKPTKGLAKVLN